jgi:hypothetical protein
LPTCRGSFLAPRSHNDSISFFGAPAIRRQLRASHAIDPALLTPALPDI